LSSLEDYYEVTEPWVVGQLLLWAAKTDQRLTANCDKHGENTGE